MSFKIEMHSKNVILEQKISEEKNNIPDDKIPLKVLYYSFKKYKRSNLYCELVQYVIFLALFIYLNLNIMDIPTAYQQNSIIYDHFLDEEFENANYKKTFFDVGNINEYYDWLEGPFYNGLFQENIVIDYNIPIGGIFIRQSRIKHKKCNFLKNNGYCFNSFNSDNRFIGTFQNKTCETNIYPQLYGKAEYGQNYGRDGCVIYIPINETIALEKISEIRNNKWIDNSTRAVAIYINLYNLNTKLLTNVRFMYELFPSGYSLPSYRIISMPYNPDGYLLSIFTTCIAFSIGVLYFIYIEFKEYRNKKKKSEYFLSKWNVIECFNLLLFVSVIAIFLYWKYNINKDGYLITISNKSDSFDFYSDSYLFYHIGLLSATCCLVSFIKIFKYLRLNRRLKLLWDTLSSAFADLFSMFIVSLLIISGFALMGNLIFGQNLDDFKSFSSSVSMLLRSLLGDFNYKQMSDLCPNIAPIYFVCYIFIVFFVITNMFVAVVCEYFQKVSNYAKEFNKNKSSVIVVGFSERIYMKFCKKRRCFKANSTNNKLKRSNTFSDIWNTNNENKKCISMFFPKWRTLKLRYKITMIFDKLLIDDYTYKKIFKIYEQSKIDLVNINDLNKITNDEVISQKIINLYSKIIKNS